MESVSSLLLMRSIEAVGCCRAGQFTSCARNSAPPDSAMILLCVILLVLALPFAYDSSAMVRYHARFYFYYAYVTLMAVLLVPVMALRPRSVENLILASRACRVVSRVVGLRWTVRGAERLSLPESCVIVANHQSSLDILGMFEVWETMERVTVVAKREILFMGPFGLAAWLCGLIFIDRTDPMKARETISQAVDASLPLKNKVWVFPEGTRRNTETIHPFKKGAFHLAIAHQLPIVPVVFSSYNFLDSSQKIFEPGEAVMTVLPPIETKGLIEADVEPILEKTRHAMMDTFQSCHPSLPIIASLSS